MNVAAAIEQVPTCATTWLRPIVARRFADLLLFGVTSAALAFRFLQAPAFRLVDWIYVLQHLLVLGIALTRPEPSVADNSVQSNIAVGVAYVYPMHRLSACRGGLAWHSGRKEELFWLHSLRSAV